MSKQIIKVFGHNLKEGDTFFDVDNRVFKVIKEIENIEPKNTSEWVELILTFEDNTVKKHLFDGSVVMILLDIDEIIKRSNL